MQHTVTEVRMATANREDSEAEATKLLWIFIAVELAGEHSVDGNNDQKKEKGIQNWFHLFIIGFFRSVKRARVSLKN